MIAINYPSLQATATSMIEAMGRSAALRAIDGVGAEIPVTVLMMNQSRYQSSSDGALAGYDPRRALIAATAGVIPDPEKHRLILDATVFRIVTVRALRPDNVTLYYDCEVRG
jgi:hypothetical protein